jgi:glycosidase
MVTRHFEFYKSIVFYEVNIRQYTPEGTFTSFSKHIPRLHEMGVDVLWLMPAHPIGVVNRKGKLGSYYAISNHHEVNPEFGTKRELKELIEMAHANGMKIILDWVANHVATDHVWTVEHPDYLETNEDGSFYSPNGWTDVIQINHKNTRAHQAMIAEMTYWIEEFDIDGFRADLAHLTPLEFWISARNHTHQIKSDLIWLAESEHEAYFQAFDVLFAWKWMHLSEDFCKGKNNWNDLVFYLKSQCSEKAKSYYKLYFTSNHDENSWNGTEFEKYGVYADLFTVLHFFLPFAVPLIYSGQELPNEKRLEFFERDAISWEHGIKKNTFYKKLIQIRKQIFEFEKPEIEILDNGLLTLSRSGKKKTVKLILNLGVEDARYINISGISIDDIRVLLEKENTREENNGYLSPGGYLLIEIGL